MTNHMWRLAPARIRVCQCLCMLLVIGACSWVLSSSTRPCTMERFEGDTGGQVAMAISALSGIGTTLDAMKVIAQADLKMKDDQNKKQDAQIAASRSQFAPPPPAAPTTTPAAHPV